MLFFCFVLHLCFCCTKRKNTIIEHVFTQMLMGGGGSFSAGGPGKGMHSRLCKFYLCLAHCLVWSAICFNLAIIFN